MAVVTRDWAREPLRASGPNDAAYATPLRVVTPQQVARLEAPALIASGAERRLALPSAVSVVGSPAVLPAAARTFPQALTFSRQAPVPVDPRAIEAQKASLNNSLDVQLFEAGRQIAEQSRQQKAHLYRELEEQKLQHGLKIDEHAALLRNRLDWQAQQQREELRQTALHWKTLFAAGPPYGPSPQDLDQALLAARTGAVPPGDPRAQEIHRFGYARDLDSKVQEGMFLIDQEVQKQKVELDRRVYEQKVAYAQQMDIIGAQIAARLDALDKEQRHQVYQEAMSQKAQLEQQACALVQEYLNQELGEKLELNKAVMQADYAQRLRMLELETAAKVRSVSYDVRSPPPPPSASAYEPLLRLPALSAPCGAAFHDGYPRPLGAFAGSSAQPYHGAPLAAGFPGAPGPAVDLPGMPPYGDPLGPMEFRQPPYGSPYGDPGSFDRR
eukprot:TRINITY_DN5370_c0_g2_i2.p1 TRINITY_DN5370_c0_g2~~TRINITY_DN5370_c0_g2_i2.p1  ORF type:complete len:442 (+),score=100.95 TRINITY_DN5370_c0_g2_i2:2-1327(+)